MTKPRAGEARAPNRPLVLIAAYDAARRTSEGHIAISMLERLGPNVRILLLTRRNNVDALRRDAELRRRAPTIHVIGFDLPRWAAWWKKGARGYEAYAYLWQLCWPLVFWMRRRPSMPFDVVHVLNFHNDRIPSLAWLLGAPTVWGPINHNEEIPAWRQGRWPRKVARRDLLKARVRQLLWRVDPMLRLAGAKMTIILSAGPWVDDRLRLGRRPGVLRRSQLGVREDLPLLAKPPRREAEVRLVSAGRLDWIKGLDLAIEALARLPDGTRLTLIGDGSARPMLEALMREKRISDRVTFSLPLSRDELIREFNRHDLMLFPSAEAAGLIWVEALASGLPVVGFDGPTEIAQMAGRLPGITLAADHRDYSRNIDSLVDAIDMALRSPPDREEVARAAREHYGWNNLAGEILRAYRTVMTAPR